MSTSRIHDGDFEARRAVQARTANRGARPAGTRRLRLACSQVQEARGRPDEPEGPRAGAAAEEGLGSLVGSSPAMRGVYELLRRVAPTRATVLAVGATGTGKELVAQTIHLLSERSSEPFIAISCGAMTPSLVESELFGHERGAFTGADRRRPGIFERASGGTLFLDEVTEMPPELQVKLLRVLETGTFTRLGSATPIAVDVRLVAATNRDPEWAVERGRLREDLFYRLNVFRVDLPSLADRGGDLELLARSFLDEMNGRSGERKTLTEEALAQLASHRWPGNVRELRHVIERAHILADDRIREEHVIFDERSKEYGGLVRARVGTSIEAMERALVEATLERLGGDKREAARLLGISLKTLYNRLAVYGKQGAPPAE